MKKTIKKVSVVALGVAVLAIFIIKVPAVVKVIGDQLITSLISSTGDEVDDSEQCTPETCVDPSTENSAPLPGTPQTPGKIKTPTPAPTPPVAPTPVPLAPPPDIIAPTPIAGEVGCTADEWDCTQWSECAVEGIQTRSCYLGVDCVDVVTDRPNDYQECVPAPKDEPRPVVAPKPQPQPEPEPTPQPQSNTPVQEQIQALQQATTLAQEGPQLLGYEIPVAHLTPYQQQAVAQLQLQDQNMTPLEQQVQQQEIALQQGQITQEANVEIAHSDEAKLEAIMQGNSAFQNIIDTTPALFLEALRKDVGDIDQDGIPNAADADPFSADKNGNGIPDSIDQAVGINPTQVDARDVALRAKFAVEKQNLIQNGMPPQEAGYIAQQELNAVRAGFKIAAIRTIAENKYGVTIKNHSDDSNNDGVSDEVAIQLGLDPKAKPLIKGLSIAEAKLYGATPEGFGKNKCTTNIYSGSKLSLNGGVVLAACPSQNTSYTLFAIDINGKETPLQTKMSSANNKIVFAIGKNLPAGRYIFQVRKDKKPISDMPVWSWPISTAFAAEEAPQGVVEKSDPVIVDIAQDSLIEKPLVQRVGNVDLGSTTNGANGITITTSADGRVHIQGTADNTSTVVGTFSSAVFTSAMLADAASGSFEVTSSAPLEPGAHQAVIYATHPETGTQSEPVTVNFNIVGVAKAATEESINANTNLKGSLGGALDQHGAAAAPASSFPIVPVGIVVGIALLITVAGLMMRRKKTTI